MRTALFVLALVVGLTGERSPVMAQYPGQFYSPGQNNPMVGINAAGYGDWVFGPRVVVIEDYGYYRPYRPYYYQGRVRPVYRRW